MRHALLPEMCPGRYVPGHLHRSTVRKDHAWLNVAEAHGQLLRPCLQLPGARSESDGHRLSAPVLDRRAPCLHGVAQGTRGGHSQGPVDPGGEAGLLQEVPQPQQ